MTNKARILSVDDDLTISDLICAALPEDKFSVSVAYSGEEGVRKAGAGKFDLVIMDIQMPGMDGITALGEIKKIDPQLEVIIATGHGTMGTAIQSLRKGAFDYLHKPMDTGEVLKTYHGTTGTEEIVYQDGVLYLVVGDPGDQEARDAAVRRGESVPVVKRHIVVVDAHSGDILWKTAETGVPEVFALTLATHNGRVFYQTTEELIARDANNGEVLWRVSRPAELSRRAVQWMLERG